MIVIAQQPATPPRIPALNTMRYRWKSGSIDPELQMVRVEGTNGRPYGFGDGEAPRPMEVREFWIATVPVTQALWVHVMGSEDNPSVNRGAQRPLDNVSWDRITLEGGFLDRINESDLCALMLAEASVCGGVFRLPSEAEWEYAARGGPYWHDGFRYSGSNDIDHVAWYDRKGGDHTRDVAGKSPNQLGIYDMSGNVWEWCQDTFTPDALKLPADGSAFVGQGNERVLRGGCFHNWAMHCTVSKRYQIEHDYHDGCIGFRLVVSVAGSSG
jgi:formylglycine-generating enzyme required for sulfatase activity